MAAPDNIEVAAHLWFGIGGNAEPCQLSGWSVPEPGQAWSINGGSRLQIPYREGQGNLVLEISCLPNLAPPVVRDARLAISANGVPIWDERVSGEMTLSLPVPSAALQGEPTLTVELAHPDSFKPSALRINSDDRQLGFAVRDVLLLWVPAAAPFTIRSRPPLPSADGGLEAAVRFCTALSPPDLLHNFESLGHNCEFGMVQRAAGAEPIGLLRFGGITIPSLLQGLDYAFEGIEEPSRLRAYTQRGTRGEEFYVRDDRYGVEFHSDQLEGNTTADALVAKFARHLRFLRGHFEEVLQSGSRIFVVKHPDLQLQAQALPVLNLLRSHGPNVLLYVTETASSNARNPDTLPLPGTVVQEAADLFHGYIDQFSPVWAADRVNLQAWLSIAANTYRMWREQGGGA